MFLVGEEKWWSTAPASALSEACFLCLPNKAKLLMVRQRIHVVVGYCLRQKLVEHQ